MSIAVCSNYPLVHDTLVHSTRSRYPLHSCSCKLSVLTIFVHKGQLYKLMAPSMKGVPIRLYLKSQDRIEISYQQVYSRSKSFGLGVHQASKVSLFHENP